MRVSKMYAPTLREVPSEAEIPSHQLLLRAGFMRKSTNGMYTLLPLAWRVIKKIENIIREEMDRKGAQDHSAQNHAFGMEMLHNQTLLYFLTT